MPEQTTNIEPTLPTQVAQTTQVTRATLPTQVAQVTQATQVTKTESDSGITTPSQAVELVVFDFDGTSISGSSPVMLVKYLIKAGRLKFTTILKIAVWGIAYKFRLPQNEAWVRGQVFSAFEGVPKDEADAFMAQFYDQKIAELFRKEADDAINQHRLRGREVWVVSATFEPIILRAMEFHSYTREFSTRMKTDEHNCYTRQVEGTPVEGIEKLKIVQREANALYGEDNWVLTHAYGDHHSDRDLLAAAKHPFAVSPDKPLRRTAVERGWKILDWGH